MSKEFILGLFPQWYYLLRMQWTMIGLNNGVQTAIPIVRNDVRKNCKVNGKTVKKHWTPKWSCKQNKWQNQSTLFFAPSRVNLLKTDRWIHVMLGFVLWEDEGSDGRCLRWVTMSPGWTEKGDGNQQEQQREPEESEVRMRPWGRFQKLFQKCYSQTKRIMH